MRTTRDDRTDAITKKAWNKNWDDISMKEIMEIFDYDRVKKQMAVFTRVLPRDHKILEGGCGLAPYLIRLRQLGYDVEGIDYNEGPIRKILSHDPSLPVKVGDVMAIPYPDSTFGGYISLGVIEHFTEGPLKAIREAHRVLSDGGVFVLMVPQKHVFMRLTWPLRWLKRNAFLRRVFNKPADTHYWEQYFKRQELVPLLEREGFEIREVHAMDHSHAWVAFSDFFRDNSTFDEASPLALKLGRWCEKHMKWSMACQLLIIARARK
jgi:SAM-dependent methyltransferase